MKRRYPTQVYPSFSDVHHSIHQYFDGKCTDDEILYHADISRKQLREVLHHYDEYVSLFLPFFLLDFSSPCHAVGPFILRRPFFIYLSLPSESRPRDPILTLSKPLKCAHVDHKKATRVRGHIELVRLPHHYSLGLGSLFYSRPVRHSPKDMVSISESPPFELRSPVPFFTSPIMSWTQTVLALPLRRLWVLSRSSPMAHFYFGQNDSVFSHSFAHVFSVCSYSRSCIRLSLTSGLGYQIAHIGTGGTDWTACRGICWSSVPCGGHQKARDVRHAMSQLRWSMWVWCFSDLVFYRSTPLPFIYMLLSQPSRTS